jgi:transcription factor CP2-like protein
MTTTGKRRLDEMYHTATERSEFYTMVNRDRPPILFTPTEDPEKAALEFGTELPSFYSSRNSPPPPTSLTPGPTSSILKLNGNPGDGDTTASMLSPLPPPISETKNPQYPPFGYKVELPQDAKPTIYIPNDYKVTTLNRDAHELVPVITDAQQPKLTQLSLSSQHYMNVGVPAGINISGGGIVTGASHIGDTIHGINPHHPQPPSKRVKVWPSKIEQIMIYVRQDTETTYTALHLIPPTVQGLLKAIESKYKINARNIRFLYRCNTENVTAKIDEEMLRSYCNEDSYLMQVMVTGDGDREENNYYDITLTQT